MFSKLLPPEGVPHAISVPSLINACPLVPTPSLVVTLLAFLTITSPLVVIGSLNPLGLLAHFIPPASPLSAVNTWSLAGAFTFKFASSIILSATVKASSPVTSPVCVAFVSLAVFKATLELLLTSVSKSDIVLAGCVPVWFALALSVE